jgi:hypothetical protein
MGSDREARKGHRKEWPLDPSPLMVYEDGIEASSWLGEVWLSYKSSLAQV